MCLGARLQSNLHMLERQGRVRLVRRWEIKAAIAIGTVITASGEGRFIGIATHQCRQQSPLLPLLHD